MLATSTQRIFLAGPWLLLIGLSAAVSIGAMLWPWAAGILVILLLFTLLTVRELSGLRFWQQITIIALMGLIVLGYGFANLTLPRVPLPVAHLLMFGGLLLALPGRWADIRAFFREPASWCWLGLMGLTALHLIAEAPVYGAWAVRDSSFVVEGIFLLSGFLWARTQRGFPHMVRNLMVVFLVNLAYSFTWPVSERLEAISPRSGVFLDVPLLGTYHQNFLFLILGAAYVLLLGRTAFKWPPLMIYIMTLGQLLWSLVFHARMVYVGIVAVMGILALTSERRSAVKLIGAIAISVLLIGALGVLGVQFEGRFGRTSPALLVQHVRSIFLAPDTPGIYTAEWRLELLPQTIERWTSSASTIAVGEGFGQVLIDWVTPAGTPVRQPHNTHLTVLMRLGLVGLLFWLLMHARIIYVLVRSVRTSPPATIARGFAVWMTIFYVVGMLHTTVQPWLEFSQGAIPFYTLIGFGIGLAPLIGGATAKRHRTAGASWTR